MDLIDYYFYKIPMNQIKEYIGTNQLLLDNYAENYNDRIIGGDRMVLTNNFNNDQRNRFVDTINNILDKNEDINTSNLIAKQEAPQIVQNNLETFRKQPKNVPNQPLFKETFKHSDKLSMIVIFVIIFFFVLQFIMLNSINRLSIEHKKLVWMMKRNKL